MIGDNIKKGLNFGFNTDSFFGIGFGVIGDNNLEKLKAKFNEFFNLINIYGIGTVEINTEIEQLFPGILEDFIIPAIKNSNISSFSVHLPYLQLNPASLLDEYRQFSSKSMIKIVNAFKNSALNVKRFVIHLTSEFEDSIMLFPISEKEKKTLIEGAVDKAMKSMSEILAATELEPGIFALENLEVFPFGFLYPVVEKLGVSVCFDIGHWGLQGREPLSFFELFGSVEEIHIQDMTEEKPNFRTTVKNEHRPLGSGVLDIEGFLNYLKSKKFGGSLIIENRSEKDLIDSLEFLKHKKFL